MWQDVHGWCVCRAKDGTAHPFGANANNVSNASMSKGALTTGVGDLLQ
jgi:hypothetical protein